MSGAKKAKTPKPSTMEGKKPRRAKRKETYGYSQRSPELRSMLSRICCLLVAPKSPRLKFIAFLATGFLVTFVLFFFADFGQLFPDSLLRPSFEKRAALEHNVPRFRPHTICPSEGLNTAATILVISPPRNSLRRHIIRSTWGHPNVTKPLDLAVVFLVSDDKDATTGALIDWEAEVYGNVVQTKFVDLYESSLKTLDGLKWVLEYCSKSKFVIKVDDDVFINVYALKRFLDDQKIEDTSLMCLVFDNMPAISPKGAALKLFNGTTHPTYCSRSAYIMSMPVARSLHRASLTTPILSLRDVFVTGILAKQAGVKHRQVGNMYASNLWKISDLVEGKIIFAHLADQNPIAETHMWEKIFSHEKNEK